MRTDLIRVPHQTHVGGPHPGACPRVADLLAHRGLRREQETPVCVVSWILARPPGALFDFPRLSLEGVEPLHIRRRLKPLDGQQLRGARVAGEYAAQPAGVGACEDEMWSLRTYTAICR